MELMRLTHVQTCSTLRRGFIMLALLAWVDLAPATEPGPRMPYEKEPAAWQRAGIEAALNDPALWVQIRTVEYCTDKKWVAHFQISTAQWLRWLGHADWNVQDMAARAAAQLGVQMPPEVQRALVRLQNERSTEPPAALHAGQALCQLGAAMIPEVQQAELACLQMADIDFELQDCAREALGQMGAAMPPGTLQALLALMKGAGSARFHAAEALARLGGSMPPQVREMMLGVLLDPRADMTLRCTAVDAMGRLGPQMPEQAREFLLSVMRDSHADKSLRSVAPAALARLGSRITPEMLEAVSSAYDGQIPAEADRDARIYHSMFQDVVAEALEKLGPDMPVAVQQRLLARFLKRTQGAQPDGHELQKEERIDAPALRALAETGLHVDPAVLHAVLDKLRDQKFSISRGVIIEEFYQALANHDLLPLAEQKAVLARVQDESADPELRGQAVLTLGQLGEKATPEARQALLSLLHHQNLDLRFRAVEAMGALGEHMPEEAIHELVTLIHDALASREAPRTAGSPAFPYLQAIELAVPALGRLGGKMPPEAHEALLAVLKSEHDNDSVCFAVASALVRCGDKLPPQVQQSLLYDFNHDFMVRTAIHMTLGVLGLHPVTDAQCAKLLALTYGKVPDDRLRAWLYLWLGRSPAQLQAVRWLGMTKDDPPLGQTPPHEILSLISRLWPHSAAHASLRHAMARRSSQIVVTQVKTYPLDEATQRVLRSLCVQLAEDSDADCATALAQAKAALAADEKARGGLQ